jgi:Fe-S-cluster containining protein
MSSSNVASKDCQEDGRVFIDMPSDESNPCLNCGACCSHYRISFYNGEMDSQPMGFVPSHMVSAVTPFIACMKGTESGGGRCSALTGKIGESIGCAIYNNRPTPCREFPVWMEDGSPNPACQSLRAKIGIAPLLPLAAKQ